ncbi:MAG TPA: four-carbon acid sugar kinase family protein [Chondromyces sp.]|nr:four-carbon acid sugar kinase family protein [Chondromyces sp.]
MNTRKVESITASYPKVDEGTVSSLLGSIRPDFRHKIIVLDDDPTGVQTVHNVSVYTDWEEATIEKAFLERSPLFFILTNSRSFTAKETEQVHRLIAERIARISRKYELPYVLISRGDSTLRGHYPLETDVLRRVLESQEGKGVDGEVIIPFFEEGGRLTISNIHFVRQGDELVPAGETEFAKDRTFGYTSSHLGEWIEEKTNGQYPKESVTYISLDSIRQLNIKAIEHQLMEVSGFGKVIVNALEETDIRIFTIALMRTIQKGKSFLFRTAAAFPKVIGEITSRPLLEREELIRSHSENGGLIIVGSHVQKTTDQLSRLQALDGIHFIELDCHLVLHREAFIEEIKRVRLEAEEKVAQGITTVIYTRRERVDLGDGMEEEELKLSVTISDSVTSIVRDFSVRPSYLIAKGGITSSDIGTKGLGVKHATVAGQVAPGVPVWQTKSESKFPFIPYIIFPGNVGDVDTLKEVVLRLEK